MPHSTVVWGGCLLPSDAPSPSLSADMSVLLCFFRVQLVAKFLLTKWGSAALSCPCARKFLLDERGWAVLCKRQFDNPVCSVTAPGKVWQLEGERALPRSNACSPSLTSKLLLNLITGVAGMLQCERAAAQERISYHTHALRIVWYYRDNTPASPLQDKNNPEISPPLLSVSGQQKRFCFNSHCQQRSFNFTPSIKIIRSDPSLLLK